MKYLKEYNSYNDVESICEEYGIKNYTINTDGSIDVDGDVDLRRKKLKNLPLNFNKVTGGFYCSGNQLTSLEGCPKSVGGGFYCLNNQLTSLEGCPKEVGNFYCNSNQLTSLKGCPKEVGGDFLCYNNLLPKLIMDNIKYIDGIIKWQDDYSIWRKDGSLDEFRFNDMMIDVKNDPYL